MVAERDQGGYFWGILPDLSLLWGTAGFCGTKNGELQGSHSIEFFMHLIFVHQPHNQLGTLNLSDHIANQCLDVTF